MRNYLLKSNFLLNQFNNECANNPKSLIVNNIKDIK